MTNYKIVTSEGDTELTSEVKADTVGLALVEACHMWGKAPENIRVWAWHKERGKESWLECYIAPDFLKVLKEIYPTNGEPSRLQSA